MSKIKFFTILKFSALLGVSLTLFQVEPSNAKASDVTLMVIGHKPKLNPFSLPEGGLASGATTRVSDYIKVGVPVKLSDMGLNLAELLIDTDGDREGGSIVEWAVDNGEWVKSETFTPSSTDGGQRIKVRVTPKTSTGIPDEGGAIESSNNVIIRSGIIDRFTLHTTKGTLTQGSAEQYCNNLGLRLPTQQELITAFLEGTSLKSPATNFDMCNYYGWPLTSRCGGSLNAYWSNTKLDYVGMQSGSPGKHVSDTNIANVACIKD